MTPEDILAWRMACSRFAIRIMIGRQKSLQIKRVGEIVPAFTASLLFANNADFFLTYHSASLDTSDYERMRRLRSLR